MVPIDKVGILEPGVRRFLRSCADIWETGGKAKPLKAAKKATKELDDEDKAFLEKKKAGAFYLALPTLAPSY